MSKKSTRRSFLGQSAALSAGVGYFASTTPRLFAEDTPMQKLAAGCIGVGGKGGSDTSHIADNGVQIAGLCDVDGDILTKKGREFSDAKQFDDFREMLDQLGDKIDIVTVSTPDHTHAVAAVKAMRMKKHVYCQKPLTWSIAEARLMRETAEETGVVTQMGNQGTSQDGLREGVEVIRSGAIGDVSEVHIWSNRPVWPQGQGRPEGEDPIPANLNWDSWIGPAPMRPYKAGAYHSFNWRGWVDFGTGALGDMACHTTNLSVMALKLWDPIAMTALINPGIVEGETFPGSSSLKFEFPEREGFPACDFFWYDGGNLPPDHIISQLPKSFQRKIESLRKDPTQRKTSGAVVVGSKGMLFSPDDYGGQYVLLPSDQYADFKPPAQTLPRIPFDSGVDERQKWEFVSTIKGEYEPGTMSNFGYAGRLTETILAGNLAMRAGEGQRIEWDAKTMTSPNVPAVNDFVSREYREGWELEGLMQPAHA
ncbi:Inositol 2-dehydrogenase [Rubripirellula tenax]|uniref:Inositol 2-dehydrogenase n=1 Tax=Rubripirellula tenax TaxID=2528015 RepID=A0A5C6FH63_9BACT|nr:Gfo/Idh/MocA family oxidoreductase [Rubripirellula tenax]TWU60861.1 Inositol 2-dehydrogenase [Rubripirellula tenax]